MAATKTPSGAASAHMPDNFKADFEFKSLYKRPGFGKFGRIANIQCNSYRIKQFPTGNVWQYDVNIVGKGTEKRATLRKVFYSDAMKKALGAHDPASILYDGNRLMWSIKQLDFGEDMTTIVDLDQEHGRRPSTRDSAENSFRVRVRRTSRVPLQVLEAFLNGTIPMDREVLIGYTFFEHLLRETPAKKYTAIKRSFFKNEGLSRLDGGVEAWKGIFQSVRPAQGGFLTINVDLAAAVFWTEGNLVNTLVKLLRLSSPDDLINRLKRDQNDLKRLKRIGFYTQHRNTESERSKKFTVEGFTKKNAIEETFEQRDRDTGKTTTLSVATYYHKQYNIRLRFPQLPLVKTKKKFVLFPMELCIVYPGQRYPFKLDERQTSDMIRFTVQRPNVRQESIRSGVNELNWGDDPILRKYGMKVDTNMITTQARILPPPTIAYGPGSQQGTFKPDGGRWDLRGKKFARPTILQSWAIAIAALPRRVQKQAVENFIGQFVTTFIAHGGKVENKNPKVMFLDPNKEMSEAVREVYIAAGNQSNKRPQILMFILTAKSAQPYNDIKAACDTVIGVTSQCVQYKHVEQAKAQYCSNVCMKFNAKLGGTTVYLDKGSHPFYGKEPTMYIGADVSHGGAFGSGGHKAASFASMVGSVDVQGARYSAVCNTNGERVESITSPNIMRFLPILFKNYRKNTQQIPRKIIYFRDGVSEGEYTKVIEDEVYDIKRAAKSLDPNWEPMMTVIVATKRHHSRFFPRDKKDGDRNGNVLPGTIIEKDITHPTDFDFFLCSHSAIQGTARATKYSVIMDENKLTPDLIQALIYNFCYTYMRATCSVSLVPPVYYAHLASTRARAHEIGGEQRDREAAAASRRERGETTPSGADASARTPVMEVEDIRPINGQIQDSMWFI